MELRTRQIGSCTLYEGTAGTWNSASLGRRSSRAYILMVLGECEPEDYFAETRAEHEDISEVFRQLGRPARGLFGRRRLRRHIASGGKVTCAPGAEDKDDTGAGLLPTVGP